MEWGGCEAPASRLRLRRRPPRASSPALYGSRLEVGGRALGVREFLFRGVRTFSERLKNPNVRIFHMDPGALVGGFASSLGPRLGGPQTRENTKRMKKCDFQ